MGRWLIITGALLIALGLARRWLSKLGLGRLPGDMHVERDGLSFHLPPLSGIVVAVVISVLIWICRR